ncbi:sec-independent translocase family protein [Anaplasma phagocytophilum str. CRT53-1]|uniref:Sec-independent translocase family protein n=1 Tax=Anaplasma phagocytophilum str. CRT53-1 TaxID=1359157 RepID=A0A0F3Q4X8_ANAPH|nr:sec-independent translocase family protein [Anaplasma phagocytophilum str. CRT53-1]
MNKGTMSLADHLKELRRRVLFSIAFFVLVFIACYFFSEKIYEFLLVPLVDLEGIMRIFR